MRGDGQGRTVLWDTVRALLGEYMARLRRRHLRLRKFFLHVFFRLYWIGYMIGAHRGRVSEVFSQGVVVVAMGNQCNHVN
jgi:hypothetical protein